MQGRLYNLLRRVIPPHYRLVLRRTAASLRARLSREGAGRLDYAIRRLQEKARFARELDVSVLPPIHAYWANTYLVPMLAPFGFTTHEGFFAKAIMETPSVEGSTRVLSLGAGNCDNEVRIARRLREQQCTNWTICCLDLVPEMLERGRQQVAAEGLSEHFEFIAADFNSWQPADRFDVVMANQCLHHVVELETLFANIRTMLRPGGRFAISDMIGRNGHLRWPEARRIVERFWSELPLAYRFHRQLWRREHRFLDWDCSVSGFEGIRSQDILPLLHTHFHFELFIAYGNVIDPFIDRGFGGHFDVGRDWDRDFIDRVHAADEAALASGEITPTHLMAICVLDPPAALRCRPGREPARSIRRPD